MNYKVGDVIEQEAFGGLRRFVLVSGRESDIKRGRPGFSGRLCDSHGSQLLGPNGRPAGVWGYDYQILRVVRRG